MGSLLVGLPGKMPLWSPCISPISGSSGCWDTEWNLALHGCGCQSGRDMEDGVPPSPLVAGVQESRVWSATHMFTGPKRSGGHWRRSV